MQTEIKASVCVCVEACMRMHAPSHSVMFNSLWPHGLQPTRLLCPYNFSGKNTGVGCHFFLWGIFLIQGLNSHPLQLLHWQVYSFLLFLICFNLILFYFFFGRCILYHCATWEAQGSLYIIQNLGSELGDPLRAQPDAKAFLYKENSIGCFCCWFQRLA